MHDGAKPALNLLERAGFRWIGEIDPFDGGPFLGATASEVVPIRETVTGQLAAGNPAEAGALQIASTEQGGAFRATVTPAETEGEAIRITVAARKRLGLETGEEVALTPLPPSSRARGTRG